MRDQPESLVSPFKPSYSNQESLTWAVENRFECVLHDLRNFMNVLGMNLELALSQSEQNDPQRKFVGYAQIAFQQARSLLHELESEELVQSLGTCRTFADLLTQVSQAALYHPNTRCELKLEADLWAICLSEEAVGRIMVNLILNAQQAMPQGGLIQLEAVNVWPDNGDARLKQAFVKVSVRDNGNGMQPETIARIFEAGFTTKSKGRGLGLAITHSIVTNSGGWMEVDSQPGQGTTFQVWLPALIGNQTFSQPPQIWPVWTNDALRLLVVEDNRELQALLKEIFEQEGHNATIVEDGQQALNCYEQSLSFGQPYQLLLLDLTIPGKISAYNTFQQLRSFNPNLKAIVFSGRTSDPYFVQPHRYGFAGAIPKPFDVAELLRLIYQVAIR